MGTAHRAPAIVPWWAIVPLLAALVGAPGSLATPLAPRPPQGPTAFCAGPALARPLQDASPAEEPDPRGPGSAVPLGPDGAHLFVPAGERLTYRVLLSVGSVVDVDVGRFTLTTGLEPLRGSSDGARPDPREGALRNEAWIRAQGAGTYLGYRVDHSLEGRYLPQAWPSIVHREVESGTEGRRRELLYGTRDGVARTWYRTNHHCPGCDRPEHHVERSLFSPAGHCTDCGRGEHRVWAEPHEREVPAGAVDLLGALYRLRESVRAQQERTTFPVLVKDGYWDVTLLLGATSEQEVPAGRFRCRALKVDPVDGDGEGITENLRPLFGPEGDLTLWVDARSGVAVRVEGVLDVGPVDLGLSIGLESSAGTPADLIPLAPEVEDGAPPGPGDDGQREGR